MAGDDDEISMQEVFTRSLYVTPTTTEQHLIVSNDKSITYVHCVSKKNNRPKRLRSTFCTKPLSPIEANTLY